MNKPLESIESSSPMITRAVASGLQNQPQKFYTFHSWQSFLLRILGIFPQSISRPVITGFQAFSGFPQSEMVNFSLDTLIQTRIDDYANISKKVSSVVIGVGMGGATAHLALALDAPFLPQAFVLTLQGGSYRGDVDEYLLRSSEIALSIAHRDPRLITIQHFDPIHDGWLTRFENHLRFKLIDLPQHYEEFLNRCLIPGGTVVYLEGGASWLRYRLGKRSFFQVGGWGDISPHEYLQGSDRIEAYARKFGLNSSNWSLQTNEYPLETGPESEWGSEPGLAEALKDYCKKNNFQFMKVNFADPNDFSRLAFEATKLMLAKDGREPAGTLIECFSQFDCRAVLQGGLLPLWLIFNTRDSARFLKSMSGNFPPGKPVFFSGLSTFSLTPDMASWNEWRDAIGSDFINIGARESHYPSDPLALLEWNKPLTRWLQHNFNPLVARLSPIELLDIASRISTENSISRKISDV